MQDVNNENKQNIKVLVENVIKGYVDSKVGRKFSAYRGDFQTPRDKRQSKDNILRRVNRHLS